MLYQLSYTRNARRLWVPASTCRASMVGEGFEPS